MTPPTPPTIWLNNARINFVLLLSVFQGPKTPKKCGYKNTQKLTVQKLWQNQNFGSLTSIFGYNFTKNLRNIGFSRRNDCPIFQNYFFGTFWRNLRKILGTDFPKTAKNGQKCFFSHKSAAFAKTGQNLKKAAVLRF